MDFTVINYYLQIDSAMRIIYIVRKTRIYCCGSSFKSQLFLFSFGTVCISYIYNTLTTTLTISPLRL